MPSALLSASLSGIGSWPGAISYYLVSCDHSLPKTNGYLTSMDCWGISCSARLTFSEVERASLPGSTSVEVGWLIGVSSMTGSCSTCAGSLGTGVSGVLFFSSFRRRASRFFSSVRRKTLIVVRKDLLGLQSSAATGVCSQTGQDEGRVDWPIRY